MFKKLPMQIATRSRFSSQVNLQSTAFTDEDLDLPGPILDPGKAGPAHLVLEHQPTGQGDLGLVGIEIHRLTLTDERAAVIGGV